MRTTVVLDDKLVAEAREVLGARTLRSLLETALRDAVKARQRQMLIEELSSGALALTITEDDLEQMRRDRPVVAEWASQEHGSERGARADAGSRNVES